MFCASAGIKGLLLFGLLIGASSCTVIGYGIGRFDDGKSAAIAAESPGRAREAPALRTHHAAYPLRGESVAKPYSDRVTDGTFGTITMLQLQTDDGVQGVDTTVIEAVLFREVPISSRLLGLALGCLLDIYVYIEAQKFRFNMF